MSTSIIQFVLEKIPDSASNTVLSRHGIDCDAVEDLTRWLRWCQAFCRDAERKMNREERIRYWLNCINDVAYKTEDLLDSLVILEDEFPEGKLGRMEAIKGILRISRKAYNYRKTNNRLQKEIEEIKLVLDEISKDACNFGIQADVHDHKQRRRLPSVPQLITNIDSDVIGFTRDEDHIVQKLLGDKITPRRAVVSIVGTAGIGKTTLAHKVFSRSDVREHFDLSIWVSVSEESNLCNLLSKALSQIKPVVVTEHEISKEYFCNEMKKSLSGKRYLIVLDDIWEDDSWSHIADAFPDESNGSRVLLTTRFLDVAKVADSKSEPCKLQFLSNNESLEVFFKRALPDDDYPAGIPYSLIDVGMQLVKNCGGLPLALRNLGDVLSKRAPNYSAWNRMLTWDIDAGACNNIFTDSYEGLPDILKQCFLYLAAYPKDYEICAQSLIHMWVAEGFIPLGDETPEEKAERYLEELAQRCMIQVLRRSPDGSIICFHVHVGIHNVIIQKSQTFGIVTVCSDENFDSVRSARRVAVHHSDSKVMRYTSPNVRSLLCFKYPIPELARHRMLKVLSCMGGNMEGGMKLEKLADMTQLRYLGITGLGDPGNLLSRMKRLQTIDLRAGDHGGLPDYVWQVRTLRHVKLKGYTFGPTSSANLENMQTLTGIKNRESWESGVPNLPNLRELDIQLSQGSHWSVLVNLLNTLQHLVHLNIVGNEIPIRVVNMRGFPFYNQLRSMSLREEQPFYSGHEMPFAAGMFPEHLRQLILENLRLKQDPIPVLEKNVPLLEVLRLGYRSFECDKMRCSAGGFGKLRQLELFVLEKLKEWEIEEGAMPELQELKVSCCPLLSVPQGLKYLTNLQELSWALHAEPAKEAEIRNVCTGVRSITIVDLSQ